MPGTVAVPERTTSPVFLSYVNLIPFGSAPDVFFRLTDFFGSTLRRAKRRSVPNCAQDWTSMSKTSKQGSCVSFSVTTCVPSETAAPEPSASASVKEPEASEPTRNTSNGTALSPVSPAPQTSLVSVKA